MKLNSLLVKIIALFLVIFIFYTPRVNAQTSSLSVSGKVTNENSNGMPGVTVTIKGASSNTLTGEDGSYNISVPNGKGVLVFSSVGFRPQEIAVNNRAIIDLTLGVSQKALEEVVVVGYGSQKKSDVTGAVTSI
ncbi:MAG TPA: carboxypeptidase-like regulatory domain-containing protein, partial [Hanamia sp.]